MFRIKTRHLAFIFMGMVVLIYMLDDNKIASVHSGDYGSDELAEVVLTDSFPKGVACILCYSDESELYAKMKYNLEQVSRSGDYDMTFYKLNTGGNLEIPVTSVYNNGQEVERILGTVSMSNLKMILNRVNTANAD